MTKTARLSGAPKPRHLDIKPCPFCGGFPETMPSGEGGRGLMIQCIQPACVNPHVSYYDHKVAIARWNQRDGKHA